MKAGANRKYIVFTTNRSGSVWLMSTLNALTDVTAQGELFLPRPRTKERRWDSDFACPRYIESEHKETHFRPFSVFGYLDDLYVNSGVVGFKLMYRQLALYPEIALYLLRHRVRVVHLVRRNHLDVLLSYEVKAKIGRAHLLSGETAPEDVCVTLDIADLVKRLERLQRKQSIARTFLTLWQLPHLEVAYEDLLQDEARFRDVFDFLQVELEEELPQSTLVKIRRKGHRDVISNYDAVKEVLLNSRFAGLIE